MLGQAANFMSSQMGHNKWKSKFRVRKNRPKLRKSHLSQQKANQTMRIKVNSFKLYQNGLKISLKGESNPTSSSLPHSSSTPPTNHHSRFEALWIPDNKATKCLMAGCDTRFSMLRRKHHCRQCGWLICQKCVGQAPVRVKGWARVKVCPQCFQENKNACG